MDGKSTLTFRYLRDYFNQSLENIFPTSEIESFFYILVEHVFDLSRVDFILNQNNTVIDSDFKEFQSFTSRLQNHEPIQHIIGETEFFSLKFRVNSHTLIPRPETEELIRWIIEDHSQNEQLKILDIGTGSGCIPISLASHFFNAKIDAIDISKEAIEVAKSNAKLNKVKINFINLDILNCDALEEKYDIIISNPPYIRDLEKIEIQNNVLNFEPHIALFVPDNDPLIFYRKISELANKSLHPDGKLYFEINEYLGKEMTDLLKHQNYQDIILKKDIFGKDRMTRSTKAPCQ